MSNPIVVLFSSNDLSRNFPALVPVNVGAIFYDVSKDDLTSYGGPSWSSLPSVMITVNASGFPSPTMCGLVVNPSDWATVQAAINSPDNTSLLQSIVPYGSYSAGTPIEGPLTDLFNQTVIFDDNGLSPLALQQIPLLTPILANPTVGPTYWASLLKDPPSWLDAFTISYIENLSQTYQIPLQG